MELLRTCIMCWTPGALRVKQDRKGRPYGHCRECSARIFVYGRRALYGLALLPARVDEILAAMSESPELQRAADAEVTRLRDDLGATGDNDDEPRAARRTA